MKRLRITLLLSCLIAFSSYGQQRYFNPNEILTYTFSYISGKKDTVAKGEIRVKPSMDTWKYDAGQRSVTYEYVFSVRDSNYFQTGLHGLPIKTETTEVTGYTEDDEHFWAHPFRANIFYITEIAPFPYYTKGNNIIKSKSTLMIGEGWGKFQGISKMDYKISNYGKNYPGYEGSTLKEVSMKSKHHLGKSRLQMIVSDEVGIIRMAYKFPNRDALVIILKDKREG